MHHKKWWWNQCKVPLRCLQHFEMSTNSDQTKCRMHRWETSCYRRGSKRPTDVVYMKYWIFHSNITWWSDSMKGHLRVRMKVGLLSAALVTGVRPDNIPAMSIFCGVAYSRAFSQSNPEMGPENNQPLESFVNLIKWYLFVGKNQKGRNKWMSCHYFRQIIMMLR